MDCPLCGEEMKEGLIPDRDRLQWRDKNFTQRIFLSSWTEEAKAFFCPGCRQIILPVPEEAEGVLDTVERKLSAAGDKIGAVQKQWEARRTETREQKKKKKSGQKDPWEL